MHATVKMTLNILALVDLGKMTQIGSVSSCVAFAKCSASTVNTVTVTLICSFLYRSATQIETDPICVISPKAAKARRVSAIVAVAGLFTNNFLNINTQGQIQSVTGSFMHGFDENFCQFKNIN
jgi:hypothetical protein